MILGFNSTEIRRPLSNRALVLLPRDPRALAIFFPSPPIHSVLSLALQPPLKNPREPLRRREALVCFCQA